MKRRPRKFLRTLIVFLNLGAIVNVAVAWGCVLRFRLRVEESSFVCAWEDGVERAIHLIAGVGRLQVEANRFWWRTRDATTYDVSMNELELIVPSWCDFNEALPEFSNKQQLEEDRIAEAAGWPLLSFWGGTDFLPQSQTDDLVMDRYAFRHHPLFGHAEFADGAFSDPAGIGILPLCPIWPGFAINTIFYAGVLWVLFALPFKARRYFRGKRGLCPACAYPVGGSPICTECGKQIRLARRVALCAAPMACLISIASCEQKRPQAPPMPPAWSIAPPVEGRFYVLGHYTVLTPGDLSTLSSAFGDMRAVEPYDEGSWSGPVTNRTSGWYLLNDANGKEEELILLYDQKGLFVVTRGWRWQSELATPMSLELRQGAQRNREDQTRVWIKYERYTPRTG